MKKIVFVALFFLFVLSVNAQTDHTNFCGTITPEAKANLKERIFANKAAIAAGILTQRSPDEVIYIPVTYHLIANSSGAGRISEGKVLDMHCKINDIYEPQNIQFFIAEDGFNYIDNNAMYDNFNQAFVAAGQQKDNKSMNVFIPQNADTPGGIGTTLGYYDPQGDWLVIRKADVNYSSDTYPHEVGHFMSLDHPFNGWDCTTYEDWSEENPDEECAPSFAPCQGFNVAVEKADGSNCETAGDYLCDTPADYNLGFYAAGCAYNGDACDPDGNPLTPEPLNMMGYFLACEIHTFTSEQEEIMLADLMSNSRNYLFFNGTPTTEYITDEVALIAPEDGELVPAYNSVFVDWSSVDNANKYLLEVSLVPTFTGSLTDRYTVLGHSKWLYNLNASTPYFWRVRPYNELSTCSDWMSGSFTTGTEVNTNEIAEKVQSMQVMPNPLSKGSELTLQLETSTKFTAQLNLLDVAGKIVKTYDAQEFKVGNNTLRLASDNLSKGLYIVNVQSELGTINRKLIITE